MLWRESAASLKEGAFNTNLANPRLITEHAGPMQENKLDMLMYKTHCELLANSITSAAHSVSQNISREEAFKSWDRFSTLDSIQRLFQEAPVAAYTQQRITAQRQPASLAMSGGIPIITEQQ
ncbi:unnamed protein product [Pleuronectes platessa]|uniref:Uncharacterized protein n=1 Tax=Pleuronectes platessa TaxID=8262 RepID=A0A9N7VEU2_PLEPL|nr:unnamed protein product [Pleuronectes platessa]